MSLINLKPTSIGKQAEKLACNYLAQQGLKLVTRNYHSRQGEIDLIMKDQSTLVFIEVKYRQSQGFGGAISAITATKQEKIKQCATFYLQQSGFNEYNTACRFDAVIIEGSIDNPTINWLKNAF